MHCVIMKISTTILAVCCKVLDSLGANMVASLERSGQYTLNVTEIVRVKRSISYRNTIRNANKIIPCYES